MRTAMLVMACPASGLGLRPRRLSVRAVAQRGKGQGQGSILLAAEAVCVVSSAALSMGFVARGDGRLLAAAMAATSAAVGIGAWCRQAERGVGSLWERVERVEAEVRESAAVVRALSRQVEKLGIRLRLTRRALKDPIAQTAALAQKNSEATRAVAAQEDILENELSELQRVLLAMQEHQRKQLDLILAIAKTAHFCTSQHNHQSL